MLTSTCLLLFQVTMLYAALPLPSYIEPCARHDPNLDACALEHGKAAIPHLIKGDRKYGVPPLDPFLVSDITVPAGAITLHLQDAKVNGMKDVELKKVQFDLKNLQVFYEMMFPTLQVISKYDIDGKILLLPITGKGDLNLTMISADTKAHVNLRIVQIDGRDHLEFYNFTTQIEPTRAYFLLTNLFNGNKLLGEEMNAVLNKQWRDVYKDLGGPIIETANTIIQKITTNFAKILPLDAWFPEKV